MFSGLNSLKKLQLYRNNLTTLPADVFKHLPRPLEISLYDSRYDPVGNPLQCNADLCWLKKEEMKGTITWLTYSFATFKPRCANGIDWDTWICNVPTPGNMQVIIIESKHIEYNPQISFRKKKTTESRVKLMHIFSHRYYLRKCVQP